MRCTSPLTAYFPATGGRPVFTPPQGLYRQAELPCGGCIPCRIDRASQWTVRLMHEVSLHDHSAFVTLTYDDEHCPSDYSLQPSHWQKFIRSLRKRTGLKLRYLVAGEYGEKGSRPHYHAIIFGLPPLSDEVPWRMSKGHQTTRSAFLEETWGRGMVVIGESVTHESCGYVVSYCLKDGNRDDRDDFVWENEFGERIFRRKPFIFMSTKPGIGHDWLRRWFSDVFPRDEVVKLTRSAPKPGAPSKFKNVAIPAPRYYLRKLQQWNRSLYADVIAKRLAHATDPRNAAENTPERRAVREQVAISRIKARDRQL
jgi:hypothetical protein